MLADFSLLSGSWMHFSRLAAFVAPFGRFFRDLGRSSLDFEAQVGHMLGGSCCPLPHFSKFFCTTCVMAQVR